MTNWMTWRIGALAVVVLVIVGLAILVPRAPFTADPGCLTASPPPTPDVEAPTVTLGLSVLADGHTFPQLVRTLALQLPVRGDDPEAPTVAGLLATSPGDTMGAENVRLEAQNLYRLALQSLLDSGPSGVFDPLTAGTILQDVRDLPTVTVDAGLGTVTIPLLANTFIESYAGAEDFVAVPWWPTFDGRDITLHTTSRLRAGTTWQVQLCVQGMQIVSTRPQPQTTDGGGRMTWSLSSSEPTAASVAVRLRPDLSTAARLWIFTDIGLYVALAWIYLGSALLVVVGLILIPRHANSAADLPQAQARLAVTTLAVVHLAVAGSLAILVTARQQKVSASNPIDLGSVLAIAAAIVGLTLLNAYWLPRGTRRWLLNVLVPGLALIAAIAWTFAYAEATRRFAAVPDLGPLEAWDTLGRALLVVGYTGLLAAAVKLWEERRERRHRARLDLALVANLIAGLAIGTPVWPELVGLVPLWVTATFATGVILLLSALLPPALRQRLPEWRRRAALIIVTALLTLIVVVQWGWATYQMQSIWWRAPIEQDPGRYLPEVSEPLSQSSLTYPLAFLGPATALFPLLGLAGLMAVLSAVGKSERAPLWSNERSWVGHVLAFLVVIFVVGYGGEVFGVRLPLALLLAVALLRLAETDRIEQAAARVAKENGGSASDGQWLLLNRRRELLDRAQALVGLEERRAAAFNTYRAAAGAARTSPDNPDEKVTLAAYDEQMAALAAEATHLRQGGPSPTEPDASTLVLPASVEPGELALALGPGRRWWERGLIALRLGSWLAWLPVAYFVYVLVVAQARPLFAAPIPFTGITFVTALANEAAFWLAAAFAFGCLFPYLRGRNGLVKGAALGAVYLVAHAGASLLGATGDTLWQVRSVQLLLFLMVLGVLMDGATVEGAALSWRYLVERYKVAEAKVALTYASSLIGLLVLLGKQLATGEAAQAVTAITTGQQQIELLLSMVGALSR